MFNDYNFCKTFNDKMKETNSRITPPCQNNFGYSQYQCNQNDYLNYEHNDHNRQHCYLKKDENVYKSNEPVNVNSFSKYNSTNYTNKQYMLNDVVTPYVDSCESFRGRSHTWSNPSKTDMYSVDTKYNSSPIYPNASYSSYYQSFEPKSACMYEQQSLKLSLENKEDTQSSQISNKSQFTTRSNKSTKKNSRRNAWGNQSYADIITMSIVNSPEKRLTLSQIYEFMIKNIPYFKNRKDSNSAAEKCDYYNKRIQNDGAGKSSWWTLNNEEENEKMGRRRAYSLDAKSNYKKCIKNKRLKNEIKRKPKNIEYSSIENMSFKRDPIIYISSDSMKNIEYKNLNKVQNPIQYNSCSTLLNPFIDKFKNGNSNQDYKYIINQLQQKKDIINSPPSCKHQSAFKVTEYSHESLNPCLFNDLVEKNDFNHVEDYSIYMEIFGEKPDFDGISTTT
ncbi:hypothetical protein A3Q56_04635 [Intoshia linei]|uniref:Fork-head domain-containing protein n=1 Tax=Intoshia linei TaxID=1819745 RepID=A0A177B028_9BILA|nr:hypothetical protein A3Q56_04635 [Intoshia linei]